MNLMQLTRKTTSETNRVVLDPTEVAYICQTKASTTIHLKGYNNFIIVIESFKEVTELWQRALEQ